MWRYIRYRLRKKFPDLELIFTKIKHHNYEIFIPSKDVKLQFLYGDLKLKDRNEDIVDLIIDSLYRNIKDRIFETKKKKSFLRRKL